MNDFQIPACGDVNSPWWRSMRHLLKDGGPLSLLRLSIGETPKGRFPFGAITQTEKMHQIGAITRTKPKHLIYWPPFEKGLPSPTPERPHPITDHVTLELWSGRSHPTWYDQNGEAKSPTPSRGWRWAPIQDCGIAHWLTELIQFDVIEEQDLEVFADIKMPTNDMARRIAEFEAHVNRSSLADIQLPPLPHMGNYALVSFFIVTAATRKNIGAIPDFLGKLPLFQVVQADLASRPWIPVPNVLTVGSTEIVIVTGCPGGTLREKNILGPSAVPDGA